MSDGTLTIYQINDLFQTEPKDPPFDSGVLQFEIVDDFLFTVKKVRCSVFMAELTFPHFGHQ